MKRSSMVGVAAFGHRDPGSNPDWFALQIQIENLFSQIIQECSTLASTVTLQWGMPL